MAEIKMEVPDKLLQAIDDLVNKGFFSSRDEFILHSLRFLLELYGAMGISLIDELAKRICPPKKKTKKGEELSQEEIFIMNLFGKSKFLYPLEIYSLALQESLKRGERPLTKEKVFEIVENLIKKGYLEKIKRGDEEIIKVVRRVEDEEGY